MESFKVYLNEKSAIENTLNKLKSDMGGQKRAQAKTTKWGTKVVLFVQEGEKETSSLVLDNGNGQWQLMVYAGPNNEIPKKVAEYDLGEDLTLVTPEKIRQIIKANTGFAPFKGR